MRVNTTFLRSKLARRIVALFVLCSLIPITLLAAISLWNVDDQLKKQNREELRQVSHEVGMNLYERLTFVEADLKLVAANSKLLADSEALEESFPALRLRLKGLERVSATGARQTLLGSVDAQANLSSKEKEYLESGRSVLKSEPCVHGTSCIIMVRALDPKAANKEFLVADISTPYLLGAEGISEEKNVCLLDSDGNEITCSGESAAAPSELDYPGSTGQFQWKENGVTYRSDYWKLFLKSNFYADHWTIVASETENDMLAPVVHFKKIFGLIALLTLWIVLLLSLTQIRRNLVPLSELQKATRQIAAGDYQSRVTVRGGDEFADVADSFNSMTARIEKQFNTIKARNAVDQAILSSLDPEHVVNALLDQLRLILPYRLASVSLLHPQTPRQILSYLSQTEGNGERVREVTSITKNDFAIFGDKPEARVFMMSDSCPPFLTPLASRGMRSFLAIPIMVRGSLSAIVSLGHDAAPIWSEEDMVQARQVGDQAGVALSNARLVIDLEDLNLGILTALARAIDAKSPWTAGHSERVTEIAVQIAQEMQLSSKDLEILRRGGLLHDIGKIGVSVALLDKPGKLTPEEFAQVKEHVEIGRRILEPIRAFSEFMPVVLEHHEWLNGAGYPRGLKGEEISIHGRIFAVADCYDAMISDRPYRSGLPLAEVLRILREHVGTQFDPRVMDAFFRVISREQEAREALSCSEEAVAG